VSPAPNKNDAAAPRREGIAGLLTPAERHTLARLVLQSRYVVEGNLAGAHRSPQKGASSEFADHRAYIPGDDPKHIDWKVLGRTDRYFVRRYEDETNLRVYLVLDGSGSMAYGSDGTTKYDYACHLAAALGYVTVKARDSVGLYLHTDRIVARLDAVNSFKHLNNLLKTAQQTRPGARTALAQTLHAVAESVRRRALIIVLSDLLDEEENVRLALAHFRKQHHDVIVFHVLDPAEIDFPFKRAARFEDMETDEAVTADPRALAADYQAAMRAFMDGYRQSCAAMRIDYRLARTDLGIETFVRAYLEERRRLSR
jgi:uncharacterized protein (DUF58 family)